MRTSLAALCALMGLLAVALAAQLGKPDTVTVTGDISDSAGNPLASVTVTAFRGAEIVRRTSNANGKYEVPIPGKGAFDLTYDRPDRRKAIFLGLADHGNHVINKVLYQQTEKTDEFERQVGELAEQYVRLRGIR